MFRGTPNTNGRPKGSSNKATDKVRKAFTQLVENNVEKMQDDLDALDPKDRLKLLIDLANFTIPKFRAIELQANIHNDNKDLLDRLLKIPEEQYDKLYKNG